MVHIVYGVDGTLRIDTRSTHHRVEPLLTGEEVTISLTAAATQMGMVIGRSNGSFLDAAANVLRRTRRPMTSQEILAQAFNRGSRPKAGRPSEPCRPLSIVMSETIPKVVSSVPVLSRSAGTSSG